MVAAIALTTLCASIFTHLNVLWNPGYYGVLGVLVDQRSWRVNQVDPGSPADRVGIKIGDAVEPPPGLRDRFMLADYGNVSPRPGERVTLSVTRAGQPRVLRLQAIPLPPLSTNDSVMLILQHIGFAILLGVGLALVLLRPSRMTWGFFLLAQLIIYASVLSTTSFFSYIPAPWYVSLITAQNVCAVAGGWGLLAFCLRFPSNSPTGWRAVIERYSPYAFFVSGLLYCYSALDGIVFMPPTESAHRLNDVLTWVFVAIAFLSITAFFVTYLEARGSERHRIRWVGLGLTCAAISATDALLFYPTSGLLASPPMWFVNALGFLYIALPLTVAYAVIRHRVIDVRFVLRRSLVLGVMAAVVVLIVLYLDWLFSTRLPSSRFAMAIYGGVTLIVGLLLSALRPRLGATIDYLFFRQVHRSQELADMVSDRVRRAKSPSDLNEPLTVGVSEAFSLASAALFERVEDGGFVRVAAVGWPHGMIWHILPNDSVVHRAAEHRRAVDVDAVSWQEPGLPPGLARPSVVVPIISGKRIPALLLLGAHDNGAGLDPDELRMIRRLAADAGLVYSGSISQPGLADVLDQRAAGATL
jgi:hypothetical protein